ncbi:cation:proton antiporter [Candidatus Micrarchaeota archaeon]|nr:cation:proton antiporter [Candidatus Micrarchaeota archaeon]
MAEIITQLGLLFVLVVAVSATLRLFKQPLVIGYIVTGIIAGPNFLNLIGANVDALTYFASLGVAILLFIVGLNLNPHVIRQMGPVSLITGGGQVVLTAAIGLAILLGLGFPFLESVYLAVALGFSSTIIITKLFSDKKSLDTLHGRIAIGVLIVQDLIAVLALMLIAPLSQNGALLDVLVKTVTQGGLLLLATAAVGFLALPHATRAVSKSQEFLLLFSLGWCFSVSAAFSYFGFSVEIGALLAGITLASSPYRVEVASKLRPLRDFFILTFFVLLGAQMAFGDVTALIWPAALLTLFIVVGKPLIVLALLTFLGYTTRTAFLAGVALAQISEFSLILVAAGAAVGHVRPEVSAMLTLVGLMSFAGSTYLILYSERIYRTVFPWLKAFKRRHAHEHEPDFGAQRFDMLLIGYDRIGYSLLHASKKLKGQWLVVDFNPDIIRLLQEKKVPCLYGDASDIDLLDDLNIKNAKLVVSTVPDPDVSLLILEKSRENQSHRPVIVMTANRIQDALKLYENGADYVLLPHFLGGAHAATLIGAYKTSASHYKAARRKHIQSLRERLDVGHEHP